MKISMVQVSYMSGKDITQKLIANLLTFIEKNIWMETLFLYSDV